MAVLQYLMEKFEVEDIIPVELNLVMDLFKIRVHVMQKSQL